MDWTSTTGIAIVTGAVAMVTALITGAIAIVTVRQQNRAAARLASDERVYRTQVEDDRVNREDKASRAQADVALQAEARLRASEAVEAFHAEMNEILAFPDGDDAAFRTHYDERWRAGKGIGFRRVVGRILRVEDRVALMEVLDALGAQADFSQWNPTNTARSFVEGVLAIGLDVAMAMERGDEQDVELLKRRDDLRRRFGQWQAHVAAKQEREWEELRREFKQEEAAHEAMMEAAQEAVEDDERAEAEAEFDPTQEEYEAARAEAEAEASYRGISEPDEDDEQSGR